MDTLLIFLPGILAFGIFTSYQDLRFGKVKNYFMLLAITYAFLGHLILYLFYFKSQPFFYFNLLLNFLLVMGVSFLLWLLRMWSAADSKLFIAYSSLLPIASTENLNIYIQTLSFFLNIFLIGLIYLFFNLLIRTKINDYAELFLIVKNKYIKKFIFLRIILLTFVLNWVVVVILNKLGLNNMLIKFVVSTFIIFPLVGLSGNYAYFILVPLSVCRIYFDKTIYSINFISEFSVIIGVLFFICAIRDFFNKLSIQKFSQQVKVDDLREGMVLMNPKKYGVNSDKTPGMHTLTNEKIDLIRKSGQRQVTIEDTTHMALIIFIAMVLTLIMKDILTPIIT
jgi:hypothetical protein